MNAMVIYQYSLHLEIRLLAVLLVLEFDKRVLQTVFGALVPNDFARHNWTKAAEDGI